MNANQILNADLLDIVFDGRNKAYGAYDLRKTYNKRLGYALLATAAVLAVFFIAFFVLKAGSGNKAAEKKIAVTDVQLSDYKQPPAQKKATPPPPPPPPKVPPKIEMKQFTVPKVVKDNEVKPTEKPPTQTEATKVTIGNVTQHGIAGTNLLAAPPEVHGIGGTGTGPATQKADYNQEFTSVQVEAKYPGGPDAWQRYLRSNLRENVPVDNGAPVGSYTVVVSFLVSRDGSVTEVKAIDAPNPDYGTAAEAVRVIERSGNWQPAIQNGRNVTYRQKQRIIFTVQEN